MADSDRHPVNRFASDGVDGGVARQPGTVSMGFAPGSALPPLDWRRRFRLRRSLADVDVPHARFGLLALRTRIEERYLVERFGDKYRAYMDRVGRFFPKLPA